MTMLADRSWKLKYTPEDGDLVKLFYIPALEDAERYDRLTGYFNAGALALAARGIEGLVRNGGHMRLVVGCTLEPPEIQAIEAGEDLRERVDKCLATLPLAPPDADASSALELLAWMVACGHLDVKVAVPCDAAGKPVHDSGIFHEKAGIIEDRGGDKIAWNGSLNETAAGWQRNWESINVYTSWGPDPGRVDSEEANFARIWANKAQRVIVLDVPDAARRDLMRFLPASDMPARLKEPEGKPAQRSLKKPDRPETEAERPAEDVLGDRRSRVWSFIRHAPSLTEGGESVGEATSAIEPWPHQVKAFERLYRDWPPKLLIADEVGLGKTIQAGMLLRQAWLAGRAKRILILAPKAVLGQWQIELREKFNLNWPIYDGHKMVRYPSPALRGKHEREVDREGWLKEPVVIASSQLMRRRDRAAVLLDAADSWDLVVLDEAHHARRSAAGAASEGGPNALLRLMQGLKERTRGLVLLTATPMQVHPIEVWDLLNLLDLPPEWSSNAFLDFFDDIGQPNPSSDAIDRMARLFQSVERHFGEVKTEDAQYLASLSRLKANKVLRALRDDAGIPRRQLETAERRAAIGIMRAHTPIRRLVSRHTRELLRRYFKEGMLSTPIADRRVEDRFIEMTPDERALYDAVEEYIASTYNQADANERTAVGFVMTIYRRRLASSFSALRNTLQRHLDAMANSGPTQTQTMGLDEDVPDDETSDDFLDADAVGEFEIVA
ncbi:MAG: helicase, partial [Boseongicola sp. SB0670_bin_30]|nr:helicase [Boseongicola sp. SB0670_bin_30]